MTTYTDADVARLVQTASDLRKSGYLDTSPHWMTELQAVLAPFLPDPEDALVTKMAWRYCESVGGTTEGIAEVKKAMKDVLAVVRKEGLPE